MMIHVKDIAELAVWVDKIDQKLTKLEDAVHATARDSHSRTSTVETRMNGIEQRQIKSEGVLLDLLMSSTGSERGIKEINVTLKDLGDKISALLERSNGK